MICYSRLRVEGIGIMSRYSGFRVDCAHSNSPFSLIYLLVHSIRAASSMVWSEPSKSQGDFARWWSEWNEMSFFLSRPDFSLISSWSFSSISVNSVGFPPVPLTKMPTKPLIFHYRWASLANKRTGTSGIFCLGHRVVILDWMGTSIVSINSIKHPNEHPVNMPSTATQITPQPTKDPPSILMPGDLLPSSPLRKREIGSRRQLN